MFKFDKKNLLNLEHKNNTPLLTSNSKGVRSNIKKRVRLKMIKDLNGMEISFGIFKEKN